MPKLGTKQKKLIAAKLLSPKNIVEKIIGVRKALRSVVDADNATRTERALEKAKEDFAEQERGAKEWREKNKNGSFVLTVPDVARTRR